LRRRILAVLASGSEEFGSWNWGVEVVKRVSRPYKEGVPGFGKSHTSFLPRGAGETVTQKRGEQGGPKMCPRGGIPGAQKSF